MPYMGRERPKSVRADEVRKLARVSPYESMTGPIDQPARGARDLADQRIEMVSGNGDIVDPSDNERWRCNLFQPGPAVEGDETAHRTAHGPRRTSALVR